ncbi:MAG: (2Fe-2S)-binding protein [Rhodobacteraceae bacterium]|nr:(2Fe-2S)-binding protein [Paracoccaceae bacterium]
MSRITRNEGAELFFYFGGERVKAYEGDSIAAALLAAGHTIFRRTPVSGTTRGPLCMMGVCFDCLVQIDGIGNQQACMHAVRDGMVVELQDGAFDVVTQVPAEGTL